MFTLKNECTAYKWIIGILTGVVIALISYGVAKESGIIEVSFSECLSIAATLSSLVLSIIAMLYTHASGSDTKVLSSKIQNTVEEINKQVQVVFNDTQKNSEALETMLAAIHDIEVAKTSLSEASDFFQRDDISDQEKQRSVLAGIEKSQNSMMGFLSKIQKRD